MCGRLACILGPEEYCKACSYIKLSKTESNQIYEKPNYYDGVTYTYIPSYNLCPTQVVLVLVHKSQIEVTDSSKDYIIVPMLWGTSLHASKNINMHNVRSEKLSESHMKHRCVILCDGYYEWKTVRKDKQPFYFTQEEITKLNDSGFSETIKEWEGKPVLKLAGIFHKQSVSENEMYYSCSIITTEANDDLKSIHHRMPINLQTFKDVESWINCQKFEKTESLNFLRLYIKTIINEERKSKYKIKYHAVDKKFVNNSQCKSEECIVPVKSYKRQMSLDSWCVKRGPAASSNMK